MKVPSPCVLTINGGSSSIRFAVYKAGKTPQLRLAGKIDPIDSSGTYLKISHPVEKTPQKLHLIAGDHLTAAGLVLNWIEARPIFTSV